MKVSAVQIGWKQHGGKLGGNGFYISSLPLFPPDETEQKVWLWNFFVSLFPFGVLSLKGNTPLVNFLFFYPFVCYFRTLHSNKIEMTCV